MFLFCLNIENIFTDLKCFVSNGDVDTVDTEDLIDSFFNCNSSFDGVVLPSSVILKGHHWLLQLLSDIQEPAVVVYFVSRSSRVPKVSLNCFS